MRCYQAVPVTSCLFMLTLSLTGCGLLPERDNTPVDVYTIAPKVAVQPASESCAQVLSLHNVAVSAPWTTSDMLYTQTEHQISSFAYNRWTAAPATLIGNALLESLQRSGLYRGVLNPTSPGSPDIILSISLDKGPIQIFPPQSAGKNSQATSSREVIALSASLISANSGELLASKAFSQTRQAAPNPYGGVQATNEIVGKLIGQIIDWLAQSNATIAACKAG